MLNQTQPRSIFRRVIRLREGIHIVDLLSHNPLYFVYGPAQLAFIVAGLLLLAGLVAFGARHPRVGLTLVISSVLTVLVAVDLVDRPATWVTIIGTALAAAALLALTCLVAYTTRFSLGKKLVVGNATMLLTALAATMSVDGMFNTYLFGIDWGYVSVYTWAITFVMACSTLATALIYAAYNRRNFTAYNRLTGRPDNKYPTTHGTETNTGRLHRTQTA